MQQRVLPVYSSQVRGELARWESAVSPDLSIHCSSDFEHEHARERGRKSLESSVCVLCVCVPRKSPDESRSACYLLRPAERFCAAAPGTATSRPCAQAKKRRRGRMGVLPQASGGACTLRKRPQGDPQSSRPGWHERNPWRAHLVLYILGILLSVWQILQTVSLYQSR